MDQKNYKMFYWAPDYSYCGFATSGEVKETAKKWLKNRKAKLNDRGDHNEKGSEMISNISPIPELMQVLSHTNLE